MFRKKGEEPIFKDSNEVQQFLDMLGKDEEDFLSIMDAQTINLYPKSLSPLVGIVLGLTSKLQEKIMDSNPDATEMKLLAETILILRKYLDTKYDDD